MEVDKPQPKSNEVLVKVKAAAINDFDWSLIRGKPRLYRLMFGLSKPKNPIPGIEFAGVVVSVGQEVSDFSTGDEVYGDMSEFGWGTYAEYVAINEKAVVQKPKHIGYIDAAALSHAGMLAWQGLALGQIKQGQNILINGAGGGAGVLALQIAKSLNC
jgi:NADPH:quinone reductase-like Zn-dependent oxidoreductase